MLDQVRVQGGASMEVEDNPYQPPDSPLHSPDDTALAWGQITAAELRAYVGPRARYYLRVWRYPLESPGAWARFNWAAKFLCPLWLAYRRMYVAAGLIWALAFGLTEASDVYFQGMRLSRPSRWHGIAFFASFVGLPLLCGVFGNGHYLGRARRAIAVTRAFDLSGDRVSARLAHLGGTDPLGAFALNVLCLCGTTVLDYLVMMFVP
jgi:hypothetical protein